MDGLIDKTKSETTKKQFFLKKIPRGVYSGVYIFARISYIHIYMHTYTYIHTPLSPPLRVSYGAYRDL